MNSKVANFLGLIFIIVGIFILGVYKDSTLQLLSRSNYSAKHNSEDLFMYKKSATSPKTPLVFSGSPVNIEVPSLSLNLPIQPGIYDNETKKWTLSDIKAQYATITPLSNNQRGNTFIYGHAIPGIFGKLHTINNGENVIIQTDNGLVFEYTFFGSTEVDTTDNSVFNYSGPSILTVQTCSGSFYQNRQMFAFKFKQVSSSDGKLLDRSKSTVNGVDGQTGSSDGLKMILEINRGNIIVPTLSDLMINQN